MNPELDRQMAAQQEAANQRAWEQKQAQDAQAMEKKAQDEAALAKRLAEEQQNADKLKQNDQATNNVVKDTMGIVGLMTGAALIHELSGVQSLGAVSGTPGADQGNGVASNGVISTLASMFGFNTGNADPSAPQPQTPKPGQQPTLA
jgi:hypothetical protein